MNLEVVANALLCRRPQPLAVPGEPLRGELVKRRLGTVPVDAAVDLPEPDREQLLGLGPVGTDRLVARGSVVHAPADRVDATVLFRRPLDHAAGPWLLRSSGHQ